jgi:hypothetical protein
MLTIHAMLGGVYQRRERFEMQRLRKLAGAPIAGTLLMLAIGLGCAQKEAASPEPFGRLSVDQVAGKLGTTNVYVFDNNPKKKYEAGHVPGAKWVDFDQVTASDLPGDKAATLIFYCANER